MIIRKITAALATFAITLSVSANVNAVNYKYTISDAVAILKYVANLQNLNSYQAALYDFNGNGEIGIDNAVEILKAVAEITTPIKKDSNVRNLKPLEPLSEEIELRIGTDYLEQIKISNPRQTDLIEKYGDYSLNGVFVKYFGTYNSNVAVRMNDNYSAPPAVYTPPKIINVAGYEFSVPYDQRGVSIWRDGEFYGLAKAYDDGFLTEQDVGDIWWHYNQRNGREDISIGGFELKQYTRATINWDFDGSCVLIVMDKKLAGKPFAPSFFGDLPIEDFDALSGDVRNPKKELSTFPRILKIDFSFDDKQSVLDVIKELELVEGIRSVEPNCYASPD